MAEYSGKIGIFGGTFDPVHYAHLFFAQTALEAAGLDKVLFMPSPDPYYRTDKKVTDSRLRLEMIRLAIADNENFELSDFEIRLAENGDTTYTGSTLQAFKMENPDAELYFILGGDSLFSIENWQAPEVIFESCTLISSKRQGEAEGASGSCAPTGRAMENLDDEFEAHARYLREKYGAVIINANFPNIEISSSAIIKKIREGKSIKYFVPDKVSEYIKEKDIYGSIQIF